MQPEKNNQLQTNIHGESRASVHERLLQETESSMNHKILVKKNPKSDYLDSPDVQAFKIIKEKQAKMEQEIKR